MGRALLAYSGSRESIKAIGRFTQIELRPDLAVKTVTFAQSPEVADELSADVAGDCRVDGYDWEVEHVAGTPHKSLLQHATDWNADVIIVSKLGASTVLCPEHAWIGDNGQRDRPSLLAQDEPSFAANGQDSNCRGQLDLQQFVFCLRAGGWTTPRELPSKLTRRDVPPQVTPLQLTKDAI